MGRVSTGLSGEKKTKTKKKAKAKDSKVCCERRGRNNTEKKNQGNRGR